MKDKLIYLERYFNGSPYRERIRTISPLDARKSKDLHKRRMKGGDRMTEHGYAETYARILSGRTVSNLVEVGILRGGGLAMWSVLFPSATVIGLDIDTSIFKRHLPELRRKGAFTHSFPEVRTFDQLRPSMAWAEGRKFDVVIDDGLHTDRAILSCFNAFLPHLSQDFIYFVEDNGTVHKKLQEIGGIVVENFGLLTVIRRSDG